MTNVDVIVNDLLRRIEKLEKNVGELQARYWELNRRTIGQVPLGSTSEPDFGGSESRDYKKR